MEPEPTQAPEAGPSIVSVGGILVGSDALYAFGSQGPSAWEDILASDPNYPYIQNPDFWDYPRWNGQSAGLLKPDIAAYTGVRTTNGPAGYKSSFSGTSAATSRMNARMGRHLSSTG